MVLSTTVFSCASFSKKGFRKEVEKLDKTNITKLNGNYSFYPIKKYIGNDKKEGNNISDSLKYYFNAYDELNGELAYPPKKIGFDSLFKKENEYQISLNVENKNNLRIKVSENSTVIKDTILTGKHKKGMFYLDNKFLKCWGVPYLFGGCQNNKRRIGITKKGNLLINEAVDNGGAILVIIAGGYSYNVAFEYERK